MMRFLTAAVLLGCSSGLWGCVATTEDDRSADVIDRAAFLFKHYAEAQKHQDAGMLGVVRGDLRRLNTDAMDVLIRGLASGSTEYRGYAAFALGFSASRAAMAPLVAATSHDDDTVRGNAIAALGQLGFPDAPAEPFQRLLKDPLPELRHATLFGLAFLASPKNDLGLLDAVHECLTDPEPNVRLEALIVVRKLRRKESVAAILAGVLKDSEPAVRASGALALGAIGKDAKEATPFLVELLRDEVHQVVAGAWTALNKIHDKDFDRSYSTWRDWYEDEQRVQYICLEHKEVVEQALGNCPRCQNRLERISRESIRKMTPPPPPPPPPPVTSASGLWACPDHQDIVTTSASKCGKTGCGKEFIPRKADPVIYACPEHAEVLTTNPTKCGRPGCGKDLLPRK